MPRARIASPARLAAAFFVIATLSLGDLATRAAAAVIDAAGQCVGDANGDGHVTADEIVSSVNNSLGGCGMTEVKIQFRAQVGDAPFACGTMYEDIGASHSSWLPADFRFYVSEVRLTKADHSEVPVRLIKDAWQDDDTALLDFEDRTQPCNNGNAQTNTSIRGVVPAGEYTGVHFVLGIPFEKNHQDASIAESPLNLTSMFWGWQGGYKFVRVDSFIVEEGAFDEFRIHLGSTGCRYGRPLEVAGCTHPNRADVRLSAFDPSTDVIVADLAAVLADSDLTSNVPETAPGCMSDVGDTDCTPLLRNLGVDEDDGFPLSTQKFFRVEPATPAP